MPHAGPLSLKFSDQAFAIFISLDYDGNVEISHGADMTLMFPHASAVPRSVPFHSAIIHDLLSASDATAPIAQRESGFTARVLKILHASTIADKIRISLHSRR